MGGKRRIYFFWIFLFCFVTPGVFRRLLHWETSVGRIPSKKQSAQLYLEILKLEKEETMNAKLFPTICVGLILIVMANSSKPACGQTGMKRPQGGVVVTETNQIRDHRRPNGGLRPPIVGQPGSGQTDAYAGVFNGATQIEVLQPGLTTQMRGQWKNVGDMNLANSMDSAWLIIRGMIKNELTHFFRKDPRDHRNRETMESIAGRRLYDLNITMSDSGRATMFLTVPASGDSMTLQYRVTGNRMRFKADVDNFFDPTITIETTITFSITLQPTNNAQHPLRVSSASLALSDTKADIDGNKLFDALKKLVEFIKGTNFERRIESLVNGKSQEITAQAEKAAGLINNRLVPHAQSGASAVQFAYNRNPGILVVKMSAPKPMLTAK
jgi:hypothetical protein